MGNNFSSTPKFTSATSATSAASNSGSSNNSESNSSKNKPINDSLTWYNKIKDKLKDGEVCNSFKEEGLDELILSLGDETRFLNRYLRLDDNHLKQITKDLRKLDDIQKNRNITSEEELRKSDKFNVYLFISKLSDNRSDSPFLRFLANSLFKNKYGMFHVGLEINGIILEWGTGDAGPHLIYPRVNTDRLYEKIAHIRVSYFSQEFNLLDAMRKLLFFEPNIGVVPSKKLQIIAQKCVNWNKNFYYSPLSRNCQHFIDEMLEALDLKFNPEGEFEKFLDRIIKNTDDRFLFQEKQFFSRQDLDQFANQNWMKISNFWDQRLLLCYSDMMNNMYENNHDEKWGPIKNKLEWDEREYALVRTD
ncbi:uncharacterized protein OCT59_006117 [Rhizophagus irregularis]|uniref:PPPDE domain-containing protein n=2 Tax=Rhizophagus irregularis TaxID=588596 RepID=U9TRV8_RHIID|nr:hypothetical protein GLOIN_2v1487848 [Rhizophagus irregularis DAOM 181602=DAOM 197198]EXX76528.1 hypothetical protein RirG_032370 [Rhizophagus irregularis DAOM 197198w]UZO14666.1 hypothetical protein OCT59_006117 [Rhizophagus irregularis]POG59406.1 hypothetical protein GLOIN_2v1487848 [Rhizophagus irregularis DAOM 181602=DAOM 197198]CAG8521233.1 8291_t:CDS:1 [Rhizophagus irregularis]GBC38418.1 hypothetical protein RIR_jg4771.t1 [Rhizophagus irregularis DAOM 181602=DAOM 197198]|eukprot:XP_025166272.1 hypothetical protein GLOIN_2v1487848 [Rhizophagus irregularis DAOM 181602=DAOM 197198]